jgi:UDP-N-acetyl-D-mannosaminuronate dehydrogenase
LNKKSQKKNLVVGLGEIGLPIFKLISSSVPTAGYDIDSKLMKNKNFKKYEKYTTSILHVCIPFNSNFEQNVKSIFDKFKPECIVIHSTISPYTTKKIQNKISIPIIYSATRGVHKRMLKDLQRYTKFFAIEQNAPKRNWAILEYSKLLKKCKVKPKKMSDPITLELAKIVVDTTYYGWLINYAQISNLIAKKHNVNYDEMWQFSDEIQKFVGNRPKLFPGYIGGHCVIPNLSLIDEDFFWQIDKINNVYASNVKNAKSIAKKYAKGKQSYDKN